MATIHLQGFRRRISLSLEFGQRNSPFGPLRLSSNTTKSLSVEGLHAFHLANINLAKSLEGGGEKWSTWNQVVATTEIPLLSSNFLKINLHFPILLFYFRPKTKNIIWKTRMSVGGNSIPMDMVGWWCRPDGINWIICGCQASHWGQGSMLRWVGQGSE